MNVQQKEQLFTLDELAGLVDLPKRTVRYYIQIELIDRPQGVGRGAHYTARHLEQLVEIRKWQRRGVSLERIRELRTSDEAETLLPPPKLRERGAVEVRSHVMIDDGVEITIDPQRSGLTPGDMRKFVKGVTELYEEIHANEE